jgi:hypothetical protein
MNTCANALYTISYYYQIITTSQSASSPALYFGAYDGTGAAPGVDLFTPVKWSLLGRKGGVDGTGIDGSGNNIDGNYYSLNSTVVPYKSGTAIPIQFRAISNYTTLQVQYKCNAGGLGTVNLDTFTVMVDDLEG